MRLKINHTRTALNYPIAVIEGLPRDGAEITPEQLEALAFLLLDVARDNRFEVLGIREYAFK